MTPPAVLAAPLPRPVVLARLALLVALVVVALIVLWPTRPAAGAQSALQLWFARLHREGLPHWIGFPLVESAANVVMFLPLGLTAAVGFPRLRAVLVVLGWVAVSAVIELVQWTLVPGRTGDWRDVLANGGGAALGVLLGRTLLAPGRRTAQGRR